MALWRVRRLHRLPHATLGATLSLATATVTPTTTLVAAATLTANHATHAAIAAAGTAVPAVLREVEQVVG